MMRKKMLIINFCGDIPNIIFATEEQSREWLENRRRTKGVVYLFVKERM